MANPTRFERSYDYSDFSETSPGDQQPGSWLDTEFDDLKTTTDEIISALGDIRRSDGKLKNGIITRDALSSSVFFGFEAPVAWAPATEYFTTSAVTVGYLVYLCLMQHTSSGTFSTDLVAGKWRLLVDLTPTNTDRISVLDYGATTSVGQTPTARRAAMQAALDAGAAANLPVRIPRGTWIIEGALRYKSGAVILCDGIDSTILKLSDTAHEDENVLEPYAFDSSITTVQIRGGLTCDGNYARPTVTGVGARRPGSSGFVTGGARFVYVDAVKAVDCVLHGIDISNGGEDDRYSGYISDSNVSSVGAAIPSAGSSTYHPANESQFVFIGLAIAENCGDDGFTSHYCQYVYVDRVVSINSGLRHPSHGASAAVEIDDGSRDMQIGQIWSGQANRGVIMKSHGGFATPAGITIGTVFAEQCALGVAFDSNPLELLPVRDCQIGTVVVRAPARLDPLSAVNLIGVNFSNARDCTIGDIVATANGDEIDSDWGPALQFDTSAVRCSVNTLKARNWRYAESANTVGAGALRFTDTCVDCSVGLVSATNCGWRGVVDTGATRAFVRGIALVGTSIAGSIGLFASVNPAQKGSQYPIVEATGYAETYKMDVYVARPGGRVNQTFARTDTSSASNVTYTQIDDLRLPLAPGKTFLVEYFLLVVAAATTTGIQIALNIPADATLFGGSVEGPGDTGTPLAAVLTGDLTSNAALTSTFSTTVPTMIRLSAIVQAGVASQSCAPNIRSEVNTSTVTVKAKSFGRATQLD